MAMTVVSNVSWDQAAWEKFAYFTLHPELLFDNVADVKGEHLTAEASPSITFSFVNDLSANTTPLNESTDITAKNISDTNITLNMTEYGDAVQRSRLTGLTSFLAVDPVIAANVGWQAGISQDTLASNALLAGTNVRYSGQTSSPARNKITPANVLTAADVRYVVAKMRGASVMEGPDGLFTAYINPDVSVDLTTETGSAAWRDPHTYGQDQRAIWRGEIGAFQGVRFVETPRAPVISDAGSSTTLTDVYATYFLGRQALAKGYSKNDGNGPIARIRPTPVIDLLSRFTGLSWYWFGGYKVFRQEALWRVESASSIGTNA